MENLATLYDTFLDTLEDSFREMYNPEQEEGTLTIVFHTPFRLSENDYLNSIVFYEDCISLLIAENGKCVEGLGVACLIPYGYEILKGLSDVENLVFTRDVDHEGGRPEIPKWTIQVIDEEGNNDGVIYANKPLYPSLTHAEETLRIFKGYWENISEQKRFCEFVDEHIEGMGLILIDDEFNL